MTDAVRIGSDEHKRLSCRMFVETHDRLAVKILPKKPDAPALRNPAGAPQ